MQRSRLAQRLSSAALALAVIAPLSFFSAGRASAAACDPIIDSLLFADLVLYATRSSKRTPNTVIAHDPCSTVSGQAPGIESVTGQVTWDRGKQDFLRMYTQTSTTTWTDASSAGPYDNREVTGYRSEFVDVSDTDPRSTTALKNWYVRRNTYVTAYNAGPEPRRRGSTLKIKGVVKRLSVNNKGVARYVRYKRHAIDIHFRPQTSSRYVRIGSMKTDSKGRFSYQAKATVDGCWKVYSSQTDHYRGRWSKRADCVDVR